MNKELKDLVEEILENDVDVIVPVKKIWKMLQFSDKYKEIPVTTLSEFIETLRGDERFEFLPAVDYDGIYEGLGDEEKAERESEMESLGFFKGERIKLIKIELTGELLGEMMEKSVNRMMNALEKAWDTRPDGKGTEKKLLEIMKKTQQLQKDIQKTVANMKQTSTKPPKDH